MSEDRISGALDALTRAPAASWPEPAAVRRIARRRRRTRRAVVPVVAGSLALAITLGLVLPGGSQRAAPSLHVAAGQHVAARVGAAVQLVADARPLAKPDPSDAAAVARAEQAFSLELLRLVDASSLANANVVLSPFSVGIALAMLQNGAGGRTRSEIAHVLQSDDLSTAQQDAGWAALTAELSAAGKSAGVWLESANSLWLQRGLHVQAPFLDALARYFDTGVWQVDFAGDTAAATAAINAWTSTHTHRKITKLFQPGGIDPSTALVLANAVYFDAAWKNSFDPKQTAAGSFTSADGTKITVPFMRYDLGSTPAGSTSGILVASSTAYDAVQLPYSGGRFAALAIMPARGSLSDFVNGLTSERFTTIARTLAPQHVALRFPKFTLQQYTGLNAPLAAMGMPSAFSNGADFSALSPGLHVQAVAHRAYLKVDERGTEAAAVTGISITATGATVIREVAFDRPFLFLVRDTRTGAVLFAAEVRNPAG